MEIDKAVLKIVMLCFLVADRGYLSDSILPTEAIPDVINSTVKVGCALLELGCDDLDFEESSTRRSRNDSAATSVSNNDAGFQDGGSARDKAVFETITFVCRLIISPPLNFLGIVGNLLIFIALCKGVLKSFAVPYFVGLTLSDLFLLIFNSVGLLPSFDANSSTLRSVYAVFACYLNPLQVCFYTIGIWITVVFTVERYVAICHPITAQKMDTGARANVLVVGVYVFGFALNLSRMFRRELILKRDPVTNETFWGISMTSLGNSQEYNMVNFWTGFILNVAVPFCLMTVLNSLIVRQLTLSRNLRKSLSAATKVAKLTKSESRDGQITRTLLSISAMFFACNSCSAVASVIIAVHATNMFSDWKFRSFLEICNTLVVVNSVFNCFLYTLCSHTIRRAVLKMACSWCRDSKPNQTPTLNTISVRITGTSDFPRTTSVSV